MKCPICKEPMRRIGVGEEYIEITPEGKAIRKLPQRWACVNPYCVNYAGDLNNPNKTVSFQYQKGDKVITETDLRPSVDFSDPRHVVVDESVTEIPLKTDIKELAEKIVMEQLTPDEAMRLAARLADKATKSE